MKTVIKIEILIMKYKDKKQYKKNLVVNLLGLILMKNIFKPINEIHRHTH